jgi:DNA-directed RNA polymerase sigma subunit (sigma70/sigma32)
MDTTSTIRVPGHLYALLSKIRRVEQKQTREMGQLPSFDEVASLMGLSEKKKTLVAEACRARRVALECNYGAATTSRLSDEVMDPRDSSEAVIEAYEERVEILDRFALLDPLERTVLALRYGLEGDDASMSEVARQMEMSRRAVDLIHRRALRKLGTRGSESDRLESDVRILVADYDEPVRSRNRNIPAGHSFCECVASIKRRQGRVRSNRDTTGLPRSNKKLIS